MGINNMTLIRAQGLDIQGNDRSQIIKKTENELVDSIRNL
jgi:FMN-dependent NADH-azoreductase